MFYLFMLLCFSLILRIMKIKIKINETVREKNIQDEVKTKSNYMLKETENVRDLTVTVDINDNLKSYIEQDF